jgi:hypothetical protein
MRLILLFLNLLFVQSFHSTIVSKIKVSILNNIFGQNLNIEIPSNYESGDVYLIGFSNENSSKDLEINTVTNEKNDDLVSILVSNNLKRMRKSYGGGFDQREIGKTCLEKIYDQVQETVILNKLKKYNYQMNLLKKIENGGVSEFEKIKAIEEYNYYMESSKYASNIESGGLYKNWTNIDL